jgi:hypothetical protein
VWKHPPLEKVYEALSAVADGRVEIRDKNEAGVVSSSGTKTYTVRWSDDGTGITSNDNASHWQGYLGYPILAVLMVRGTLKYDQETARLLSGIPWKEINKRFRNDYAAAVDYVLSSLKEKGADAEKIRREAASIWKQVHGLSLEKMPGRKTK